MKSSNGYLRCPACKRPIVISWSVFPATGFLFECPRCEIRSWPSRDIKKAWRDWTITHDSDYEIIRACGLTFESTDIRREHIQNAMQETLHGVGCVAINEKDHRKIALHQISLRVCKDLELMDRILAGIEPPRADTTIHNIQTVLDEIASAIRDKETHEEDRKRLREIWMQVHAMQMERGC